MIYFSALMLSLFITLALIPLLKGLAFKAQLVDFPNPRKVHSHPIPKVGGVAMAAGTLLPVLLWAPRDRFNIAVLLGMFIIILFGLYDDIKTLSPRIKFTGQAFAALVVIFLGELTISNCGDLLRDDYQLPALLSIPLTLVVIVGVTNAINLSDGLDGLAGGIMLLSVACLGYVAFLCGDFTILLVCTTLAGGIFGFLRFNTHPATVFMGDTGSQMLGYLMIVLSIRLSQENAPLSSVFPLLLLGFPILDTLTVTAERIRAGHSPFQADRNHFHHKLMRRGLFHTEAVVAIYCVQTFLVVSAFSFRHYSDWFLLLYYSLFSGCILIFFHQSEKSGWTFKRYELIDKVIKGKLRTLRDKQVLIRFSFGLVRFGLPALFIATCFIPAKISVFVGCAALLMALFILISAFFKNKLIGPATGSAFYLFIPYLVYSAETGPAVWVPRQVHHLHSLALGVLIFFVIMTLKFTRRKRGFKPTPMDFLILLIALVLPIFTYLQLYEFPIGPIAVKTIGMLFSYEVLMGEMRQECNRLAVITTCGLLVLFVRSASL